MNQNANNSIRNTARLNGFWGKIASCNVHALKNSQLNHFKEVFKNNNVICLQETHGKPTTVKSITKRLGFKNSVFSLFHKQARGAAVLWREGNLIAKEVDKNGRIAGVALELNDCKINVISAYAPNVDGSHASWDTYLTFLTELELIADNLVEISETNNLLIMGDFNLILDPDLDSSSK